jgi:hypothetical protein
LFQLFEKLPGGFAGLPCAPTADHSGERFHLA